MNRKFASLLAVLFVWVQMFSLLHMAEHRFASHQHNGKTCEIYLHGEHHKLSTPSELVVLAVPYTVEISETPFTERFIAHARRSALIPRAPPVLS